MSCDVVAGHGDREGRLEDGARRKGKEAVVKNEGEMEGQCGSEDWILVDRTA